MGVQSIPTIQFSHGKQANAGQNLNVVPMIGKRSRKRGLRMHIMDIYNMLQGLLANSRLRLKTSTVAVDFRLYLLQWIQLTQCRQT